MRLACKKCTATGQLFYKGEWRCCYVCKGKGRINEPILAQKMRVKNDYVIAEALEDIFEIVTSEIANDIAYLGIERILSKSRKDLGGII